MDLLEALFHIVAGRLFAAIGLERIADRLDVNGGPQDATVVDHGVVHLLYRFLALRLVHRLDFMADGIVIAGAGELQGVVAFRDRKSTGRVDVGLGRGPDEAERPSTAGSRCA